MTLYESRRLFTLAQPIAAMEISTNLSDGSHVVAVPERLRGLGELLLLAPSTAQGRTQDHYQEMHATRWILDTGTGALEVVPQDWFNEGSYDFAIIGLRVQPVCLTPVRLSAKESDSACLSSIPPIARSPSGSSPTSSITPSAIEARRSLHRNRWGRFRLGDLAEHGVGKLFGL